MLNNSPNVIVVPTVTVAFTESYLSQTVRVDATVSVVQPKILSSSVTFLVTVYEIAAVDVVVFPTVTVFTVVTAVIPKLVKTAPSAQRPQFDVIVITPSSIVACTP